MKISFIEKRSILKTQLLLIQRKIIAKMYEAYLFKGYHRRCGNNIRDREIIYKYWSKTVNTTYLYVW